MVKKKTAAKIVLNKKSAAPIIQEKVRTLTPIAVAPKERAIEPAQKQQVIEALMNAWMKFPYLRLGQLVSLAAKDRTVFAVEDEPLLKELLSFDVKETQCESLSPSRMFRCTLEYGHDRDMHFNMVSETNWKRF